MHSPISTSAISSIIYLLCCNYVCSQSILNGFTELMRWAPDSQSIAYLYVDSSLSSLIFSSPPHGVGPDVNRTNGGIGVDEIVWHPSSRFAAIVWDDNSVELIERATNKTFHTVLSPNNNSAPLMGVDFNLDGNLLVILDSEGVIYAYSIASSGEPGGMSFTSSFLNSWPMALNFTAMAKRSKMMDSGANGTQFIFGTDEGAIVAFSDQNTGGLLAQGSVGVEFIDYYAPRDAFAIVTNNSELLLVPSNFGSNYFAGNIISIKGIKIVGRWLGSFDDEHVYITDLDSANGYEYWNALNSNQGFMINDRITTFDIHNQSSSIVAGTSSGSLAVWLLNTTSYTVNETWALQPAMKVGMKVDHVAWSPNGKWLLVNTGNNIEFLTSEHVLGSLTYDSRPNIQDSTSTSSTEIPDNSTEEYPPIEDAHHFNRVVWAPNSQYYVTALKDPFYGDELQFNSIPGGDVAYTRYRRESDIIGYLFDPASEYVAVGYTDGAVQVVNRIDEQYNVELSAGGNGVSIAGMEWNEDGSVLFSVDATGYVRMWNFTGNENSTSEAYMPLVLERSFNATPSMLGKRIKTSEDNETILDQSEFLLAFMNGDIAVIAEDGTWTIQQAIGSLSPILFVDWSKSLNSLVIFNADGILHVGNMDGPPLMPQVTNQSIYEQMQLFDDILIGITNTSLTLYNLTQAITSGSYAFDASNGYSEVLTITSFDYNAQNQSIAVSTANGDLFIFTRTEEPSDWNDVKSYWFSSMKRDHIENTITDVAWSKNGKYLSINTDNFIEIWTAHHAIG